MTETERITNEVMSKYGYDENDKLHTPDGEVLGEDALVGAGTAMALEVLAGLVIWGLWELHHPIMLLAHWLVAHAR
jgi:hypothetical protein